MSEGLVLLQLDPLDHLLTLRVRRRPSGPAPVGPQGQRVGRSAKQQAIQRNGRRGI